MEKPSERIDQLYFEYMERNKANYQDAYIAAIKQYLDEQAENEKYLHPEQVGEDYTNEENKNPEK